MQQQSIKPSPSLLLVDDDEDIRESLALLLRDEGYHVEVASNGREALERLDRLPAPCAMLLDLMMPVMNGWKVLEVLEARPEQHVPVLVLSAVVPPRLAGARACMRKPFDVDALLLQVKQLCAGA